MLLQLDINKIAVIAVESRGIHPSSLTFNRVGYKPPTERFVESGANAGLRPNDQGARNQNQLASAVSSVNDIEKTLQDNGLAISNNDANQTTDRRTRMALNAYTEQRNQPSKLLATAIISGFDDYA